MDDFLGYVKTMPSGAFAFVMATGVVSVGMKLTDLGAWTTWLSYFLWACAIGGWLFLALSLILRAVLHWDDLDRDFGNAATGFGYFTLPAGTLVVGIRFAAQNLWVWATVIWVLGAVIWLFFAYAIPWLVIERAHHLQRGASRVVGEPAPLSEVSPSADPAVGNEDMVAAQASTRNILSHVNGVWFVWTVSTQSVSILAAFLQLHYAGGWREFFTVIAVITWATGLGLYLAVFIAFVMRVIRQGISPVNLDPSLWVVMGALAISCLASGRLAAMDSSVALAAAIRPLASGAGVFLWGLNTWLVIGLLLLGLWRHLGRGVSFRYVTTLWAMVFPMGVYSVASMTVGAVDKVAIIAWFGKVFIWVALAAWTFVAVDWLIVKAGRAGRAVPVAH